MENAMGTTVSEFLTRKQAAELLTVSVSTLDSMLRAGRVQSIRLSKRRVVVPRQAIETLATKEMTNASS